MTFMKDALKKIEKAGISVGKSQPPSYWISTGSYALNKVISGSFKRGIPQGRITCFSGPAASGKSFNVTNLMREAQQMGMTVVVIDSESALDDDFVSKLGVDTEDPDYFYVATGTVAECKKTVSAIVGDWKKEYNGLELDDPNSLKVLIVIDSLNMLMTDNEQDQFEKGENKGDQGQKNKQLKSMLQSFTNNIRGTNITMAITAQVYQNQDLKNGKGVWIIADAVQYACSQIVLITKLNLKDKVSNLVTGIRMKCVGYKTRFAKPFESVTIEVPYNEGMDPYNGLLDIAESMGVVKKAGAWYTVDKTGEKFQSKNFDKVREGVLESCEELAESVHLEAVLQDGESEDRGDGVSQKAKRREKFERDQELATESD